MHTTYDQHCQISKVWEATKWNKAYKKGQTLTIWGEIELSWAGAFSIRVYCIINAFFMQYAARILLSRNCLWLPAIHIMMWSCGVSQSYPDDLSVSIHDVIFFNIYIFVLLVFVTLLLEMIKSNINCTRRNLSLMWRQCCFIAYQRRNLTSWNVRFYEFSKEG